MSESAAVANEIRRLHDFFEAWFSGFQGLSISDFSDALDPGFFMVTPTGSKIHRDAVVDAVAERFGGDSAKISIRNVEIERTGSGVVTATYEEHQARVGQSTARISTVTMAEDETTPGGYRWLFVHETWRGDC
jgi:hypothetical protein